MHATQSGIWDAPLLAGDIRPGSVREWNARAARLEAVLGRDVCRQMAVYPLPSDFLLSVIMPVYNEARTIAQVVDRVLATQLPLEIILVDDGSTDGTRDVLARLSQHDGLRVVFHETNRGKGAAVRTALAAAQGTVVVIQDADWEYDPDDFRFLLQPILEGSADAVFGSRFHNPNRAVSPLWHQLANQLITWCANLVTGRRFTDVETCYKMARRDVLAPLVPQLQEDRFGIEIELTCRLARERRLRICERPVRYERRSYAEGKKIGWRDGVAALWCVLRYGLFESTRPPREA